MFHGHPANLGIVGSFSHSVARRMIDQADCVVVFRALAQGQFQRFGAAPPAATASGEAALTFPYGLISPAQRFAMKTCSLGRMRL